MDLRIPPQDTSVAPSRTTRPAKDGASRAEAPERDPIADTVALDSKVRERVEAALKGEAEAPKASDAAPAEPTVTVRVLPQDNVLPARDEQVPQSDVGANLSGARFITMEDTESFRPPTADKDGNYLFDTSDPRQGAVNAHVAASKSLRIAEQYLGRKIDWGFERKSDPEHLWIHPHAGEGMNAFYNNVNGSINFLYAEDPGSRAIIDTSASLEVVSHETGHAVLDGLRPKYIDAIDTTSGGFHEAFGDCLAMLASLSDDDVVEQLYQETRGNLSRHNIISSMGEQLGAAMRGEEEPYVRSALNDHTERDPHFLPFMAFPDGPALEPHARSQVWTAAVYDLLRLVVHQNTEDSQTPFVDAVREARDTVGQLVMRGVELAPLGKITFKEAAIAMVKADFLDNDGANLENLLATFTARGILSADDATAVSSEIATAKVLGESVTLPSDFSADQDAQKLLADNAELLSLSKDDLDALSFSEMVTNDRGEKILHYTQQQQFELTEPSWGPEYQGTSFSIHGGLLLAFDDDNKLVAVTRDAITEDHVEDAKLFLKKMISFEKNPPLVIHTGGKAEEGDESAAPKTDAHLDYMLASTRRPIHVVNGEIRRSGILYCGQDESR